MPKSEESDIVEDFFGKDGGRPAHGPWHPPADVFETKDGVVARFEVAGANPKDLHLRLTGTSLQLLGNRQDSCSKQKKVYHQMEINYGNFERTLILPCHVNSKKAEANYKDGILEVFIPRSKQPFTGLLIIDISDL
jgi:HSP20 family protein